MATSSPPKGFEPWLSAYHSSGVNAQSLKNKRKITIKLHIMGKITNLPI
jgi:hypothetical protein